MFIMKTVSPNILKQLNGLVNLERPVAAFTNMD